MHSAGKQNIPVGRSKPYARCLLEEPRIFGRNNYEFQTPFSNPASSVNLSLSRSYHVVQTEGIDHPWNLGPVPNMTSVLGHSLLEWFVPLKMSHYNQPTHYLRPTYAPNFGPQPTLSPHLNARTLYVHSELSHR